MSISAMKQALEALEWNYDNAIDNLPAHKQWAGMLRQSRIALRQAIEQAEKQEGWVLREVYFSEGEPISHREPQWVGLTDEELPEGETYDFDRGVRWAERYLKQKAVPSDYPNSHQQEPVAFVSGYYGGQCVILPIYKDKLFSPGTALYTTPVHASENTEKQEPVGWLDSEGRFSYFKHLDSDEPLYAAPVHARPVVHAVRCTYPQCQATNGCVGACSKGQAEKQEPVVGTKTWFEDGKMVTQHLYASDISQERVDETAKDRHIAMRRTTRDEKIVNPGVYEVPVEKEWIGLDHDQLRNATTQFTRGAMWAERYLKEKNYK